MEEATEKEKSSRNAWRAILIPAVGSAAFFSSMVVNIMKTHKQHSWPQKAFKSSDYLLMSIPFLIIAFAIHEESVNGTEE